MIDLAWISLTGAPAASKLRRIHLSPEARAVGEYSRELWPYLDLSLRRRGLEGAFIPLEDLLWPASLQRALLELQPRLVHVQFHADFWPGRSLAGGSLTRVLSRLKRDVPGMTQWVTLHSPPPKRLWGRESLKSVDRILQHQAGPIWMPRAEYRPLEMKQNPQRSGFSNAHSSVPGVQGTVSRNPAPQPKAMTEHAVPRPEFVPAWSELADRLVDSYFQK